MQQAKNDAAKNWRATLSGGGAQMKNNIEKVQGELREQGNGNKRPAGEQQAARDIQERVHKDRSVRDQEYCFVLCIIYSFV